MKLKQRLALVAARLPSMTSAECTGGTMVLVAEGEERTIGPGTPRCAKCGGVHRLVIEEIVVDSTGAVIA